MSKVLVSRLKNFVLSSQLAEHDLELVEKKLDLDLGLNKSQKKAEQIESDYYPQIENQFRSEARKMAPHYEMFYSLEKSVRSLIAETLESDKGQNWWKSNRIPREIRENVNKAQERELEQGITPRSTEDIDFCTFGELRTIIDSNWDLFSGIFSNQKALGKVMTSLNALRNPIAHCSLLADDEILRLQITVKDWFRLMD